jgi:hydroxymethylbilane synthase
MPTPEATSALRLGTRGSRLALAQSGQIARHLEGLGHRVELVVIRTSGDKLSDVSLAKVGGKGLFLKEIEEALAAREIDLAVHSLKDVPAELPPGFAIAAIPPRAPVHDVVVVADRRDASMAASRDALPSRGDRELAGEEAIRALPANARVGTGSLRRRAQLRALRDDLDVVAMRGNVDTRLAKLEAGATDAIVLAAAGLVRLGLSVRSAALDPCAFLPAPGQGALALEVRADDAAMIARIAALDDRATARACAAERAFLRASAPAVRCRSPRTRAEPRGRMRARRRSRSTGWWRASTVEACSAIDWSVRPATPSRSGTSSRATGRARRARSPRRCRARSRTPLSALSEPDPRLRPKRARGSGAPFGLCPNGRGARAPRGANPGVARCSEPGRGRARARRASPRRARAGR